MRTLLVLFLFSSTVVLCGTFAFLGLDVTGHVFPFVGLGLFVDDDHFMVSFGLTYDRESSNWAVENSLRYFHEFDNVKLGLDFTVIFTTGGTEFLYLVGPELGYSFDVDLGRIDLGVSAMMTLPLGATGDVKGPVPFINLIWRSDTLP